MVSSDDEGSGVGFGEASLEAEGEGGGSVVGAFEAEGAFGVGDSLEVGGPDEPVVDLVLLVGAGVGPCGVVLVVEEGGGGTELAGSGPAVKPFA